jgi:hypothetical protein
MAGRGGDGPSPIGHRELELLVAICMQLLGGDDRKPNALAVDAGCQGGLPNPLWHPAIKPFRQALLKFQAGHPSRAASILARPKRHKETWNQFDTLLVTWHHYLFSEQHYAKHRDWYAEHGSQIPAGGHFFICTQNLTGKFNEWCLQDYTHLLPSCGTPEQLLARGEGQTVSRTELWNAMRFYTLECRFLKGLDVTVIWATELECDSEYEGWSLAERWSLANAKPLKGLTNVISPQSEGDEGSQPPKSNVAPFQVTEWPGHGRRRAQVFGNRRPPLALLRPVAARLPLAEPAGLPLSSRWRQRRQRGRQMKATPTVPRTQMTFRQTATSSVPLIARKV